MDTLLEKYRRLTKTSSEETTARDSQLNSKNGVGHSATTTSQKAKKYKGTYIPQQLKLPKLITVEELLSQTRRERRATKNILFPASIPRKKSKSSLSPGKSIPQPQRAENKKTVHQIDLQGTPQSRKSFVMITEAG